MDNFKKFCKEKSITFFFPIAVILTIVPLIVRMRITQSEDLDKATLDLYGKSGTSDLFTQNKEIALIAFSAILVILFIVFFKKFFEKKDKIINIMIAAALVFLGFTFLSAILSDYRHVSFWGVYDRSEGFITTLCYIVLFIYSIYTFKTTEDFKFILIPILIVTFINGFLGLFQYFGADLIKTSLGGLIAIPSKYNIDPSKLSLQFESGKLYGTLYHYNYVGSFTSLVIPILFGAIIIEDDIFLKLMSMVGSIISLWLLFGSTSRAGLLGFASIIIISCIVFGKILFKNKKVILSSFAALLIVCIGLTFATGGKIFERIPTLVSDGLSLFKSSSDFNYIDTMPIQNIEHINGTVKITVPNNTLNISYENNNFVFKNSNNEIINYASSVDSKTKAKNYVTDDPNFKNISFRSGNMNTTTRHDALLLILEGHSGTFMFNLKDDNTIHLFDTINQKDIDLEFPEVIGFKGREKLASARGYIWGRSIPLLKNTFFVGTGPDTFSFVFPQNDLIGKLYAYDTTNMVISKAHNLLLQFAINNGIIALLGFLCLVIIYIVDSIKLYALKSKYTNTQLLGGILFLSIAAYLVTGMFNDSVICVAPIFWVVLGAGGAVNFINKKIS